MLNGISQAGQGCVYSVTSETQTQRRIDMSELVGNYRDMNGDTLRVTFENRRYFYEVTCGIPDRYVSNQGPDSDRTLTRISAKH